MTLIQEGTNFALIRKGFPYGEVTDSDPMDRPEGSLAECRNMDYDVNTGELISRNPTVDSGLLAGFTIPAGYSIMPDGVKLFSFNQPIDKEVTMLFITDGTNVRIFINWDYNPPAPNTDPVGSSNDYENYRLYRTADTWYQGWVELTEYHLLIDFTRTGNLTFTVDNSALPVIGIDNYYRGWFAWNKTKYNSGTTDQIKNESFVCIESYLESGSGNWVFTIQNRIRDNLLLNNLGWNTNDEVYLMRYPVMVHKASDTSTPDLHFKFSSIKMIKTATSVNCLIGQDGNLQLSFLYRDTTEVASYGGDTTPNIHKYYGWWLDYEMYPVKTLEAGLTVAGTPSTFYSKPVIGIQFLLTEEVRTGYRTNSGAVTARINPAQYIALLTFKFGTQPPADKDVAILPKPYHHYSRKILGAEAYTTDSTSISAEPTKRQAPHNERTLIGTTENYTPFYSKSFTSDIDLNNTTYGLVGVALGATILYDPTEKIYNKASFGVYAQGRMFVSGDSDKPDNVKYSLFQKEDVMPLQNSRPIDAIDRDKNTAMSLLSINPVVFKGNSIHIANIEGQNEVGWRMLETKAQTGTNIPRSVVRTPSGVAFCNEQGIFLLQGTQEPLNLLSRRKRQAYLALANKGNIFGTWYGKHNELWYYMGNGLYWICKLSIEEKQIGWKTYYTNFVPNGMEISDDGNLYFTGSNFIYRYVNDSEVVNAQDADGHSIVWSFTENFNLFNSRRDRFHHTESAISIDYELRTSPPIIPNGNNEVITIQVYNEADELIQTKTANINVLSAKTLQIVFQNDVQNACHAIKFKISGTMNYTKRWKITELYSRIEPLPQVIKQGYKEALV